MLIHVIILVLKCVDNLAKSRSNVSFQTLKLGDVAEFKIKGRTVLSA